MRFVSAGLPDAWLVEPDVHRDERGFFTRVLCEAEFEARGLPTRFPQCNLSRNDRAGTLRGMHYESAPSQESKLVRCVSGAIYDVIVDLRPESPAFRKWVGVELDAVSARALFVPAGFAHGFLTLGDATDVFYHMGDSYRPTAARGFRFNDPAFRIAWPATPQVISERDASYPDFEAP